MRSLLCLPLAFLLFIQGCALGVMAAGIGYGISASKKGDAEVARAEADLQRSYNDYKLGMERINLEREKNKLSPQRIMAMEEWLRHQALPEKVRADLAEKQARYQSNSQPLSQQDVKQPILQDEQKGTQLENK